MIQDANPIMLLSLAVLAAAAGLAAGMALGRRKGRSSGAREGPEADIWERPQDPAPGAPEPMAAPDQAEPAAGMDPLTGTWNRRRFEEGASQHMALCARRGGTLSLILFDVDPFPRNDEASAGRSKNPVLAAVASLARQQIRVSDGLARWKDETFAVLCPDTTLAGATLLAEKIRRAMEAQTVPQAGSVTVSLGVAQHLPLETLEAWMARAREALQQAKARGRNRLEAAWESAEDPEEGPRPILQLLWDEALASGDPALDRQHQELYRLANGVLASLTGGHGREAKLQMQLLVAHVAQHFHDEEALLAEAGYPDLAAHAGEHDRLLAKAKALHLELGGAGESHPAILAFLALDLIKGHLLGWDRRFFGHLAGARRRV